MNTFALINIAKKDLGMEDDDYRSFLKVVTKKDSLRAMSESERESVVAAMKRKGWKAKPKGNFRPKSNKSYVRLIHALWRSCGEKKLLDNPTRPGLRAFVKNQSGVSDPEFLTYDQASPIIEALKAMEARG